LVAGWKDAVQRTKGWTKQKRFTLNFF
jgi:hypothetical protein